MGLIDIVHFGFECPERSEGGKDGCISLGFPSSYFFDDGHITVAFGTFQRFEVVRVVIQTQVDLPANAYRMRVGLLCPRPRGKMDLPQGTQRRLSGNLASRVVLTAEFGDNIRHAE